MALTIYQGKQKFVCKFGWYRGNDFAPATGRGFFYAQWSKNEKSSQTKEEIQ